MHKLISRSGFPAEYFETRFRIEARPLAWPESFTIVTAWAPTGQAWPLERNAAADARLRDRLEAEGLWRHRITGYDPCGDHAEPGWAIEQSLMEGVALALDFQQVGIYQVTAGDLRVVLCAEPHRLAFVARFADRLDEPAPPQPMG